MWRRPRWCGRAAFWWMLDYLRIGNGVDENGKGAFYGQVFLRPWKEDVKYLLFEKVLLGGGIIFSLGVYYLVFEQEYLKYNFFKIWFFSSMLLLILNQDFSTLFVSWEGIGLGSSILISFWHARTSTSRSGLKSLALNKLGDVSLLQILGLSISSLSSTSLSTRLSSLRVWDSEWVSLRVRYSKSAQSMLFVWLLARNWVYSTLYSARFIRARPSWAGRPSERRKGKNTISRAPRARKTHRRAFARRCTYRVVEWEYKSSS